LKEQTVQGTRPAVLEASTLINLGSRAFEQAGYTAGRGVGVGYLFSSLSMLGSVLCSVYSVVLFSVSKHNLRSACVRFKNFLFLTINKNNKYCAMGKVCRHHDMEENYKDKYLLFIVSEIFQ
jgi:hypothetical protein